MLLGCFAGMYNGDTHGEMSDGYEKSEYDVGVHNSDVFCIWQASARRLSLKLEGGQQVKSMRPTNSNFRWTR